MHPTWMLSCLILLLLQRSVIIASVACSNSTAVFTKTRDSWLYDFDWYNSCGRQKSLKLWIRERSLKIVPAIDRTHPLLCESLDSTGPVFCSTKVHTQCLIILLSSQTFKSKSHSDLQVSRWSKNDPDTCTYGGEWSSIQHYNSTCIRNREGICEWGIWSKTSVNMVNVDNMKIKLNIQWCICKFFTRENTF